uniref:Uncharacterized protein n=1 Tax=Rhizophora mucronata TaxID=61149 RepID=A0A2P2MRN4_RHIMU
MSRADLHTISLQDLCSQWSPFPIFVLRCVHSKWSFTFVFMHICDLLL